MKEKIPGGSLEWNGDEFFMLATGAAVTAMKKATIYTQGVVRKMVGGTGTGNRYKRTKSGKYHTASVPGEPPARDTGILASSLSHTVKTEGHFVQGYVGPDIDKIRNRLKTGTTDVNYGFYLEEGTKKKAGRGGNLKARPFLKPGLIKAKPKIDSIFQKALGK